MTGDPLAPPAPPSVDAAAATRRLECLKLAGSHIGMAPGAKNVEEIARRYVRFIERGKFENTE